MSSPHADKIHKLIRDRKKMAQNLKRKKKKYQPKTWYNNRHGELTAPHPLTNPTK